MQRYVYVVLLVSVVGFAAAATTFWSGTAHANCARSLSYAVFSSQQAVVVCPVNFDDRGCNDDETLLRENVETGEVTSLTTCAEEDGNYGEPPRHMLGEVDDHCFVDQCVEEGTYRYGFARPYSCHSAACSTNYFGEVEVETDISGPVCGGDDTTAEAEEKELPWDDDPTICRYGDGRDDDDGGLDLEIFR